MKVLSTIILLMASVVSVTAQDQSQSFTFPKDGSQVDAGSKTTITWNNGNSGVSKVTLQLCLFGTPVQCNGIASDVDNSGSYGWTPDSDLSNTGYFILMLNGADRLATSGSFSIGSGSGSGSSSSSSSGSSGTTGSPTGTTSSDGGPATVTVTSDNGQTSTYVTNTSTSSSGSSGVSAGTLGGAIGGTLGVVALLAVGGFLLWRQRKNKKAAEEEDDDDLEAAAGKKSKESKRSSKRKSDLLDKKGISIPDPDAGIVEAADNPVYEMPAEQEPVEAPDHRFYAMELDSREVLPQERDLQQEENLRAGDKTSPAINLSPPVVDETGKPADAYRYNLAMDISDDAKSESEYQAYKPPAVEGTTAAAAETADAKETEAPKDATNEKTEAEGEVGAGETAAAEEVKQSGATETKDDKKTDS